jgi:aldehyde:ferredoxin oxidoreductase
MQRNDLFGWAGKILSIDLSERKVSLLETKSCSRRVDFSTYDGKALAAINIQNHQFMKESLNLCDFAWPAYDDASTEDPVGDPALERQLFSAVTGRQMDEQEFHHTAGRIITLNRSVLLREGRKGRQDKSADWG